LKGVNRLRNPSSGIKGEAMESHQSL
jgi:hypothetical protein